MKILLILFLTPIVLVVLTLAWAGFPWSIGGSVTETEIIEIDPEVWSDPQEEAGVIKILTWNLGFLYGKGSEGSGYEHRPSEFYQKRIDKMIQEIRDWNPDIVCLQEIDFDSHRSSGINQARELAQKAGYPYVAEAVSWDANYIPFPYWPLQRNFGRMKSGGAILSKYPLTQHQVHLLDKPASQSWWYNIFYLHRYFQKVKFLVGEKEFTLVNLHLEAFDKLDRQSQVGKLIEMISQESLDFIAGDFNMVPDEAMKKRNFPDDSDDYHNDSSYSQMMNSGLLEAIPQEIYILDENKYFTYPSWQPNRRLDYIFYRPEHKMMRADILNSDLSDHLPLRASFQIGAPRFDIYSQ